MPRSNVLAGIGAGLFVVNADQPGADVVTTRATGCAETRKVIRLWLTGVRKDGRYTRRVAKWRCVNRPSSVEGDTIVCRKGSRQRIQWYVNIPRR